MGFGESSFGKSGGHHSADSDDWTDSIISVTPGVSVSLSTCPHMCQPRLSWWHSGGVLNFWPSGPGFDSWSGHNQGTQVISSFHPFRVGRSSTSLHCLGLRWGAFACVGRQVSLCYHRRWKHPKSGQASLFPHLPLFSFPSPPIPIPAFPSPLPHPSLHFPSPFSPSP